MPQLRIKQINKPRVAANAPRYEPRWVNGVWTVFDRRNLGHGNPLGTRKEAERVAGELNEGKRQWAA